MEKENRISKDKNILIVLNKQEKESEDLKYLKENFCGVVINELPEDLSIYKNEKIYACGDINGIDTHKSIIHIIKDVSVNYKELLSKENYKEVELGAVPIVINETGVFLRQLFNEENYFEKIESEHEFQELTESNKNSTALRKGIYLTEITKEENKKREEVLNFNLLRCSSNLTGASDNFRETDRQIINSLNEIIKYTFEEETNLNHVLAQIYQNKKKENNKEVKAKIKAHSDKTKDMPKEGIIAFCTFYDTSNFQSLSPSKTNKFDWCYKKTSGLTKLHFKLKGNVKDGSLKKEFSVTLYPNSVFLIPLSTNRLYTHEIRPSVLNIDRIPTRMGYVVRCSNLQGVYVNNQTFIKENGELVKLEEMTEETMLNLRDSYYKENRTIDAVKYGKIHFSMNSGDYKKPIY